MKKKCIFFDRDGVVNKSPGPGYVERWEDFELMTGFVDVLRIVRKSGFIAIIVTNQRCVARGIVSMATVNRLHNNLKELLKKEYGLELEDIVVCPHDNDECECRKPKPGMLLESAEKHDIDLASSWMIGDDEKDVLAGRGAGCRTIRVARAGVDTSADFRVSDMDELKARIADILKK